MAFVKFTRWLFIKAYTNTCLNDIKAYNNTCSQWELVGLVNFLPIKAFHSPRNIPPTQTRQVDMSSMLQDTRKYWYDVALPTAKRAHQDLLDFPVQLTPEGVEMWHCALEKQVETKITEMVGSDVSDASDAHAATSLDDFEHVERRLRRAILIIINTRRNDPYFRVPTTKEMAQIWLDDYMAAVYDLSMHYHSSIPCISLYVEDVQGAHFSDRFPTVAKWENDRCASHIRCIRMNTSTSAVGHVHQHHRI
jgi:hypothetical protein